MVGTQIKGASTTAALPVSVIDASQIDATGALSGDELFRSIPQAGDVTVQQIEQPADQQRGARRRQFDQSAQPGRRQHAGAAQRPPPR